MTIDNFLLVRKIVQKVGESSCNLRHLGRPHEEPRQELTLAGGQQGKEAINERGHSVAKYNCTRAFSLALKRRYARVR